MRTRFPDPFEYFRLKGGRRSAAASGGPPDAGRVLFVRPSVYAEGRTFSQGGSEIIQWDLLLCAVVVYCGSDIMISGEKLYEDPRKHRRSSKQKRR